MPGPTLICYDGSEAARAAIARAGELIDGGPAVVLDVWEQTDRFVAYDPGSVVGETVGRLAGLEREMDAIGRELAEKTAAQGAQLASEAGFDAQPRTACGRPWSTILEVADEVDARAIVMGTRGHTGLESALLGSVAARVLHHCRRPLVIVPDAD